MLKYICLFTSHGLDINAVCFSKHSSWPPQCFSCSPPCPLPNPVFWVYKYTSSVQLTAPSSLPLPPSLLSFLYTWLLSLKLLSISSSKFSLITVIEKFPEIPVPTLISLSWYLHKTHVLLMFWWCLEFRRISPKDVEHLLWLFPINPTLEYTHKSSHMFPLRWPTEELCKWLMLMNPKMFLKPDVVNQRGGGCQDSPSSAALKHFSQKSDPAGRCHHAGLTPPGTTMSAPLLPAPLLGKENTTQRETKWFSFRKF